MVILLKYCVPKGYLSIALFPFIFIKSSFLKQDLSLINHEKIHLRQQLELLIIGFYLWYGIEFLIRRMMVDSWKTAYRAIVFEREAYTHEAHLKYLKTRSFWAFLSYYKL